jgi:ribonuclease HI
LKQNQPDWKRMLFKENKVWVRMDKTGKPEIQNNRAVIKYQIDQDQEYRVLPNNLKELEPEDQRRTGHPIPPPKKRIQKAKPSVKQSDENLPENAICIYTDGAASGNPGPAGIGIWLTYGTHEKSISRYIGNATNNVAELEAIRAGLSEVKNRHLPVRVFTDSSYAYGLLVLGWRAKANRELVGDIKIIIQDFHDLKFIKVKGHDGNEGNEQADLLATTAIKNHEK